MRILLSSHFFHPSVGGIETMSLALAREFTRQGHQVVVVTSTPTPEPGPQPKVGAGVELDEELPFRVVRRPTRKYLLRLTRWCQIFLHNNISLQAAWPLLIAPRPWVVAHQTWTTRVDGSSGAQDRLKRAVLRLASNISISRAIASALPVPSIVIGNCYRDDLFRLLPEVERARDLVFLGRLVSDKGADVLIEALGRLKAQGLEPGLTVIGDGPEREPLEEMARARGVASQVRFEGARGGEDLVRLLNTHRIMVIPSRWDEPFGIVALEGIACGCAVVGSRGGGLADAIGPCGDLFDNGDAEQLARALGRLLGDAARLEALRSQAPAHLARHTPEAVASQYLAVMRAAARQPGWDRRALKYLPGSRPPQRWGRSGGRESEKETSSR